MPPDPVPLPPPPPGFDPPRQKTTLDVWMQVAQTIGYCNTHHPRWANALGHCVWRTVATQSHT